MRRELGELPRGSRRRKYKVALKLLGQILPGVRGLHARTMDCRLTWRGAVSERRSASTVAAAFDGVAHAADTVGSARSTAQFGSPTGSAIMTVVRLRQRPWRAH
jgi:hypothetical protein